MNQKEMIERLKKQSDFGWIVCEIEGRRWFSDGRIGLECAEGIFTAGIQKLDVWMRGLTKYAVGVPAGYTTALVCEMRGAFSVAYVRRIAVEGAEVSTYVQEAYFRSIGQVSAVWIKPGIEGEKAPLYFERDGKLVAFLMPMKQHSGIGGFPAVADLPEIPFLEDAVCFHTCPEDEE